MMQKKPESSVKEETEQSSRHYFFEYKEKQILYVDFSNLRTLAEKDMGIQYILQAKNLIAHKPPNSVLMLTNVENSNFDTDVAAALKEYTAHNRKFVKRSAIVGIKGLQIPLLNALNWLTGRNMRSFTDEQSAKDWLILDDSD
jgi:hypothetical protein